MSTQSPEHKSPEPELAVGSNGAEAKASGSSESEDVIMEDEKEKMQRAAKQSMHDFYLLLGLMLMSNMAVEFYFADSNLPFDK